MGRGISSGKATGIAVLKMGPTLHSEGSGSEMDSILSDIGLSSGTSPEPRHRHIAPHHLDLTGTEPLETQPFLSRSEAPVHTGQRHEVPVHTGRHHTDSHSSDGGDREGEEERFLTEGPVHTGRQNGEAVHTGEGHVHIGSRHKDVRWSDGTEWSVEEGVNGFSRRQVFAEMAKQGALAGPIMGMNVVWFLRSIVSMIFLGRLGELELAAGSLAISLANVTGYRWVCGLFRFLFFCWLKSQWLAFCRACLPTDWFPFISLRLPDLKVECSIGAEVKWQSHL